MNNKFAGNIKIEGLVQGVGFRPYIYKIALDNDIKGTVDNRTDGVYIHAEGTKKNIDKFINDIYDKKPKPAQIKDITFNKTQFENYSGFSIIKSEDNTDQITQISPDIAVCDACLEDMKKQEHRINYPFINCTNCGPRFTIIRDLPYDRAKTTMDEFQMCSKCESEYKDIFDRRFHAQPVACKNCGPQYTLHSNSSNIENTNDIIQKTADLIDNGSIVLTKGLGGFFLACNALDDTAIAKLRELKSRESKPFALMAKDLRSAGKYVSLDKTEKEQLSSFRRPIVVAGQKPLILNPKINDNLNSLGIMLPYMPFHYLLFEKMKTGLIVLTSGNFSDEPILIDNKKAVNTFKDKADGVLTYNRKIHNRADDSVTAVFNNKPVVFRRSRGFTPEPIFLDLNTEGIFAAGAELVNCFAIGKINQAIISQHIGDLQNFETLEFYEESISRFYKMFRFKPQIAACDLHPDYLSTKFANKLNIPLEKVQHHHAHIASCMAENGLDEDIIGIALDGTGLGTDGNIWGGEFFTAGLNDFQREHHFKYIPIPGGDKATKEPYRTGFSYLYEVFGNSAKDLNTPLNKSIDRSRIEILEQMIEKNINSPLSSSCGRLFDAVAAITGLCPISDYHAQAPMKLEAEIKTASNKKYEYEIYDKIISFDKMIKQIAEDVNKLSPSTISVKFHNTIISVIFEVSKIIQNKKGINKVVLSGGSFQNRYLTENAVKLLKKNNFEVYTHSKVPPNDGGLALGQMAVASKRRI